MSRSPRIGEDDHVVEEGTDHDEIGLRRFYFNLFGGDEEGFG